MIGKQERIRISLAPSKIKLTAILKCKSLGPSLDSNLACSDRMPSLHHLCHHQCHGAAFVEFFFFPFLWPEFLFRFFQAMIADSGGPMFRGFVEPTLSTLLRLLLSPQATSLEVRIILVCSWSKTRVTWNSAESASRWCQDSVMLFHVSCWRL